MHGPPSKGLTRWWACLQAAAPTSRVAAGPYPGSFGSRTMRPVPETVGLSTGGAAHIQGGCPSLSRFIRVPNNAPGSRNDRPFSPGCSLVSEQFSKFRRLILAPYNLVEAKCPVRIVLARGVRNHALHENGQCTQDVVSLALRQMTRATHQVTGRYSVTASILLRSASVEHMDQWLWDVSTQMPARKDRVADRPDESAATRRRAKFAANPITRALRAMRIRAVGNRRKVEAPGHCHCLNLWP